MARAGIVVTLHYSYINGTQSERVNVVVHHGSRIGSAAGRAFLLAALEGLKPIVTQLLASGEGHKRSDCTSVASFWIRQRSPPLVTAVSVDSDCIVRQYGQRAGDNTPVRKKRVDQIVSTGGEEAFEPRVVSIAPGFDLMRPDLLLANQTTYELDGPHHLWNEKKAIRVSIGRKVEILHDIAQFNCSRITTDHSGCMPLNVCSLALVGHIRVQREYLDYNESLRMHIPVGELGVLREVDGDGDLGIHVPCHLCGSGSFQANQEVPLSAVLEDCNHLLDR